MVNFEKHDRVPIDLGAMRASGINAVVYDKLKKRMGINTPTKIHDNMQILTEVELEVLDRLAYYLLQLKLSYLQTRKQKSGVSDGSVILHPARRTARAGKCGMTTPQITSDRTLLVWINHC